MGVGGARRGLRANRGETVADLLFVAIMVAFFALAATFVAACERIVGTDTSDSLYEAPAEEPAERQEAAA